MKIRWNFQDYLFYLKVNGGLVKLTGNFKFTGAYCYAAYLQACEFSPNFHDNSFIFRPDFFPKFSKLLPGIFWEISCTDICTASNFPSVISFLATRTDPVNFFSTSGFNTIQGTTMTGPITFDMGKYRILYIDHIYLSDQFTHVIVVSRILFVLFYILFQFDFMYMFWKLCIFVRLYSRKLMD